jgi:uncharacterized repeat protein (TIGR03803 family)
MSVLLAEYGVYTVTRNQSQALPQMRTKCSVFRNLLTLMLFVLSPFAGRAFASSALTTLYTFSATEGASPSELVRGTDGNYYGTAPTGGDPSGNSGIGYGTVFRITPGGSLTILHTFSGSDGSTPTALVLAQDGNLYGATQSGGAYNGGSVFKVTTGGTLTTIYSFPQGSLGPSLAPSRLALGNDGNFYGTTAFGGNNSCGSIFQITPTGTLTTLYSFPSDSGPAPGGGGLTPAADGSFYGVTTTMPAIFRITTAGTFTSVHTFAAGEGTPTTGALVQSANGTFYGTTVDGGANGAGSVFSVLPTGAFTTLYSFTGTAGSSTVQPGGLVDGGDGSFYGTMQYGGETSCACGAIFKVSPSGALSYLYYFTGSLDGSGPIGTLTPGSGGFYGSTASTIYWYDATSALPPYISIVVKPSVITSGKSALLTWTSTGATACTGSDAWSGAQATSGSQSLSPTQIGPDGFTLTCTGAGGVAAATAVLNVNGPPAITLSVSPSTINVGESANLVWTGDATSSTCTASGGWSGTQPSAGAQQVSPGKAGTFVYTLTCLSAAGDASVAGSTTLVVKDANTASAGGGNGRGGGGMVGVQELIGLGALLALRRRALAVVPRA